MCDVIVCRSGGKKRVGSAKKSLRGNSDYDLAAGDYDSYNPRHNRDARLPAPHSQYNDYYTSTSNSHPLDDNYGYGRAPATGGTQSYSLDDNYGYSREPATGGGSNSYSLDDHYGYSRAPATKLPPLESGSSGKKKKPKKKQVDAQYDDGLYLDPDDAVYFN